VNFHRGNFLQTPVEKPVIRLPETMAKVPWVAPMAATRAAMLNPVSRKPAATLVANPDLSQQDLVDFLI